MRSKLGKIFEYLHSKEIAHVQLFFVHADKLGIKKEKCLIIFGQN
jgi:hypothetical protein